MSKLMSKSLKNIKISNALAFLFSYFVFCGFIIIISEICGSAKFAVAILKFVIIYLSPLLWLWPIIGAEIDESENNHLLENKIEDIIFIIILIQFWFYPA